MSNIVVQRSAIHGTGVYAARAFSAGEEIIYYTGRMVTHAQADADYEETGHTFLFTLNDHWVIDASVGGNDARWINHSCAPNCEPVQVESDDGPDNDRMVIQAVRDIKAGEELTYDYGLTTPEPITDEERVLWACRCGAPACSGILLTHEAPAA